MSSTYTVSDAVALVKEIYRGTIWDHAGPMLADIAQSIVWNAADWKQTLADLPPFWLVPQEQDYAAPADCQGLRSTYLVHVTTDPIYRTPPLNIKKDLDPTYYVGVPTEISFDQASNKIRLYPSPAEFMASPEWLVEGTYKKTPTKITSSNIGTALVPIDDRFFDVFRKALAYAFLDSLSDPRAGQIQYDRRSRSYIATGALGSLRMALLDMAESENIDLGDEVIAPSEPLIPY
jgi:hypothetical protein